MDISNAPDSCKTFLYLHFFQSFTYQFCRYSIAETYIHDFVRIVWGNVLPHLANEVGCIRFLKPNCYYYPKMLCIALYNVFVD